MTIYETIKAAHSSIISENETDTEKLNRLQMQYHIDNLKRITDDKADYHKNYSAAKEQIKELYKLQKQIEQEKAAKQDITACNKAIIKQLEKDIEKDIAKITAAELQKVHINL